MIYSKDRGRPAAMLLGASAAAIFACSVGPRIMLEKPGEGGAAEVDIKTLGAELKKSNDEVKKFAEQAHTEIKNLGKLTEETKSASDKALTDFNTKTQEFDARIKELEQKGARGGGRDHVEQKSLGQIVVDSEDVKTKLLGSGGSKRGSVSLTVERKTILSASSSWGSTASVTNSLVIPDRQPVVSMPMRQMTIRDLVAPGETSSNAVEYAVQVARTNNAAPVAENTTKPYSNYTWDLRNFPVRTIAHLVKASRQILDDAPALRSVIDAEMRYGLDYIEEVQMLYGDGTGQNLLGMAPQATAYSAAFAITGETAIDRIRMAMLQAVLALYPVTGTVLNPTDWTRVQLLKDAQSRYIIGNPQGDMQPRLWNVPVVESLAMTAGNFLTGAFKYAAQIFDRMEAEVVISTENVDDFEKNMVSIRAEERLAFVVKRPAALITGALP